MNNHNEKTLKRIDKSDKRFKLSLTAALIVLAAIVVAAFVLGGILLLRLESIAERGEATQKGNLCILLIKPDDRTVSNVTSCVKNNTKDNKDSQFRDVNNDPVNNSSQAPINPVLAPTSVATITTPTEPTPEKPVKTIEPPEPEKVCRKFETRINPATKLLEYRYIGTSWWTVSAVLPECP